MRLLVDTHVWLWMVTGDERLTDDVRATLEAPDSEVYLSAAAVWELAIKAAMGKLKYSGSPAVQIPIHIQRSRSHCPFRSRSTTQSRRRTCRCITATHSIG